MSDPGPFESCRTAGAAASGEGEGGPARYCYTCRRHHPPDRPMRRIATRTGYRWRCQASISAARLEADLRDAWGREKAAESRLSARYAIETLNLQRRNRVRD